GGVMSLENEAPENPSGSMQAVAEAPATVGPLTDGLAPEARSDGRIDARAPRPRANGGETRRVMAPGKMTLAESALGGRRIQPRERSEERDVKAHGSVPPLMPEARSPDGEAHAHKNADSKPDAAPVDAGPAPVTPAPPGEEAKAPPN